MTNKEIIEKFYLSFVNADAEGMVSCYHDSIQFRDPAFGLLEGDDAKKMWRMLVRPGIKIFFENVMADEQKGSAQWTAHYIFSPTGRNVINKVSAKFEFKDGKILKHTDEFDMWKWSKQALGLKGYLLGWSAFMKNKIQQQANARLRKFNS
jgi:hypothetical protein